jgi:hypothetical protein
MLHDETRKRILERIRSILASIDPDVHLLDVVLDSTRTQLAIMLQKGEFPIVLGMEWLDFVSHKNEDLANLLREGLTNRQEVAWKRQAHEGE